MAERKPQEQDKFVLRLPDGMRSRIKAAAEANRRSMNAEIVSRLVGSLDHDDMINEHIKMDREDMIAGRNDWEHESETARRIHNAISEIFRSSPGYVNVRDEDD